MGKVKGIFAGEMSGSVGKVTFRRSNGENVVGQKITKQNNPRTEEQQIQRMKMNTVVSSYSVLSKFCDHSYQNCHGKRENFSRFVKINVGRLTLKYNYKDPVLYNFKPKGESTKFIPNEYIISEGDLRVDVSLIWDRVLQGICLSSDKKRCLSISSDVTVAQFHKIFGVEVGAQISLCGNPDYTGNTFSFTRYIWRQDVSDEKVFSPDGTINESLLSEESKIDNKVVFVHSMDTQKPCVRVSMGDYGTSAGMIISVRQLGKWRYSTSVMAVSPDVSSSYLAKNALPTYSVGSNKFLNNATV